MRKFVLGFGVLLVAASLSLAAPKSQTFAGEIMDSQCSKMGGHDPAGFKMTSTNNAKDCTLACVKMGGKFVLYGAAKKTVYQLDDQEKPRELDLAGRKVKITGTYDKGTKTIHVDTIQSE